MMTARSMYEGQSKNGRYEPTARNVVKAPAPGRERQMVLLRQLLGDVLRRLRVRQARTLREVSTLARVSLGYLSEVERGQKEASSELLASICGALGVPLSQVLREVSDQFALAELQHAPVLADVPEHERLPISETVPSTMSGPEFDGFPEVKDMVAA
jgi:transcriptional regulator with XRE-family HTH domain